LKINRLKFIICNIKKSHSLKSDLPILENIMSFASEIRTPEQRTKKMLNEERTIMDLELAVKKAKFRKTQQKNDDWDWLKNN